jgi:hypothetical protein
MVYMAIYPGRTCSSKQLLLIKVTTSTSLKEVSSTPPWSASEKP